MTSRLTVLCPELTDPNNGVINCSLGDDGVLSYEDTCSFTCNTGYELTSSDTRTCQSNGSWSGRDDVCRRGKTDYKHIVYMTYVACIIVHCPSLTSPNGRYRCNLGSNDNKKHAIKRD